MNRTAYVTIICLNVLAFYAFLIQDGILWQIGAACLAMAFILIILYQIENT